MAGSDKVIMEGPLFYATDAYGNAGEGEAGHGLYMDDTRFLSLCELLVDGRRPELLGSADGESYVLTTLLKHEEKDVGAIEIERTSFIHEGALHEQLTVTNYFPEKRTINLTLRFDADFQDMFIVRRYRTGETGSRQATQAIPGGMLLRYLGLDDKWRRTRIQWEGTPVAAEAEQTIQYSLTLAAGEKQDIRLCIIPEQGTGAEPSAGKQPASYGEALNSLRESYRDWRASNTRATSSNPVFNRLFERSLQDLRMLQRDLGYGRTFVAGLPWFATVFGRDSLITSLFMLPLHPTHALGTLRTLAATQGQAADPQRDEEPGKIMHEIRFGELTQTGQSPFGPYYGGVDSTPLFLLLLAEYVKWTGDTAIAVELQPAIDAALQWIDRRCEGNAAGFLTYRQEAEQGFPNQGWKDSANSLVHRSGKLADAPIALIEVQGYICRAKSGLADIYMALGQQERSESLKREAAGMSEQIERYFWMEEEQFYSVALDGELQPVSSVTSNPGHLLWNTLLRPERARRVASRLLAEDMFTGYGVRTMSSRAAGYYPMSYHNGSVWPHDNGMMMLGCLQAGRFEEAAGIASGLLRTAAEVPDYRFPELLCGYGSKEYGRLIPYPATCSPQAWSGATAFVMLQAALGLQADALHGRVFLQPNLPPDIQELKAEGISLGRGVLDLELRTDPGTGQTRAAILQNTTGLEIIIRSGQGE